MATDTLVIVGGNVSAHGFFIFFDTINRILWTINDTVVALETHAADIAAARDDAIVATGRSDYPNQVNNVLGFPYIFRGALDVRASTINEEMKIAAAKALAELAREDVPDEVAAAYAGERLQYTWRVNSSRLITFE